MNPDRGNPGSLTLSPGHLVALSSFALLVLLALGLAGGWWYRALAGKQAPAALGPFQHWEQARQAIEEHDFLQAREHLRQCLEYWPLDAEAHFLLARICRRAGDATGWQIHLRDARALQWPGQELELEALLMKAQTGDVRSVEPILRQRLEAEDPQEELIFEAVARGYLETGRIQDALDLTGLWTERRPQEELAWLYRARAESANRNVQAAMTDYGHALELLPADAAAQVELASLLSFQTRFEEALSHYQACLQSRPDDAAALTGAAHCRLALGRMD